MLLSMDVISSGLGYAYIVYTKEECNARISGLLRSSVLWVS
jgi:hypothetical protein